MTIDWNLAGTIILSGLFVVFVFLIVMGSMLKKIGAAANATVKTAPAATAPSLAFAPAALPVGGDEAEIAAISAAIACYMEAAAPGVPYAVRQIVRRTTGERPVWGFAGMLGNTRPF